MAHRAVCEAQTNVYIANYKHTFTPSYWPYLGTQLEKSLAQNLADSVEDSASPPPNKKNLLSFLKWLRNNVEKVQSGFSKKQFIEEGGDLK